jgi:hypothetical protein
MHDEGDLTINEALSLLSQDDHDEAKTTAVVVLPAVPAALATFVDGGVLPDDALQQLLGLAEDYGQELLTTLNCQIVDINYRLTGEDAWWLLNSIRPVDQPHLWVAPQLKPDSLVAHCVIKASNVFIADLRTRPVPQWEVAAFWFASSMVHVTGAFPDLNLAIRFSSILRIQLENLRESFRTALAIVDGGRGLFGQIDNADDESDWWGYVQGLRIKTCQDSWRGGCF